jgi:hypothetical protein
MLRKLFVAATAAGTAAAWGGFVMARNAFRTWGVDEGEASAAMPGDDLIPEPMTQDTRVLEIAGPPAGVWPWLVQMGFGRAGWYSYDGVDMNHPSADRIIPELQALAVGDSLPVAPGLGFEVKVLEPDRALVVYVDRALIEAQQAAVRSSGEAPAETPANLRASGAYLDRTMAGEFQASWAFVLEPLVGDRTRLVERVRARMEPATPPADGRPRQVPPVARSMLGFGIFVMIRRQMLGIRDRAEGRALRPSPAWRFAGGRLSGLPAR